MTFAKIAEHISADKKYKANSNNLFTFTVDGHYGGCCLRSDPTLVIKKDSDIEPLIVLEDKHFLAD